MESTLARDIDARLANLIGSERHLAVQFVVELAEFAKHELYRELGYASLFYYCVRQLGLSKSSAFRRSEAARLIARFPAIAERLATGRVSIRALVELREVLTEENLPEVLKRAEGRSQEEAQLLAVEYKPRPVPRDVVRAVPVRDVARASPSSNAVPVPLPSSSVASRELSLVPAGTDSRPAPEVVKPLTPDLRRLNVTVSAEFMAELEQVRAALSHELPDGNFEQVVREAFKLVLERDRKRKALTDRLRRQRDIKSSARSEPARQDQVSCPRPEPARANQVSSPRPEFARESDRYVPAPIKRTVWKRDQGRCTWPMGDGRPCGSTHRLEFDHVLEVALGGKATLDNIRLLCKRHNLMKAEERFGKALMSKFRKAPSGRWATPDTLNGRYLG